MDPFANIEQQLALAREAVHINDHGAEEFGALSSEQAMRLTDIAGELAELVLALDEWRRKGGFDPYDQPQPQEV